MSSSELADALNPNASRRSSLAASGHLYPAPNYALQPSRSELLEVAIVEPPSRSQPPQQRDVELTQRRPSQAELTAVTYKDVVRACQEFEHQRYLEREQRLVAHFEGLLSATRADADQKISVLRQELDHLRSIVYQTVQSPRHGGYPSYPTPPAESAPPFHFITSPVSQQATLTQKHEDKFPASQTSEYGSMGMNLDRQIPDPRLTADGSSSASSPSSSQNASSESVSPATSPSPPASQVPYKNKRRGRSDSMTSSSRESERSSDSSGSRVRKPPRKRANHQDKRCVSIQHAMRTHLYQMLGVSGDGTLPDSHLEGTVLEDWEPVRFVWDKTTKQSIHNARMKIRVLSDIKDNRSLYKNVQSKDFGKKILDAAFEQCFTTFRAKYRAQNDDEVAQMSKKREEAKARKARHVSRRKMKLTNRAEARLKLPVFEDLAFDPALQIECMSSEESDWEDGTRSTDTLRTRGYSWRSSRLLNFYGELDKEEMSDKSTRPKRGVGKRLRVTGPVQDNILPPKGVATWMISRRWYKVTKATHPDLPERLQALVIDDSGQWDSGRFKMLGEETSDFDKSDASPIESPSLSSHTFPPEGDDAEQEDGQPMKNYTFPPSTDTPTRPSHCPFPSSSLHFAFVHQR